MRFAVLFVLLVSAAAALAQQAPTPTAVPAVPAVAPAAVPTPAAPAAPAPAPEPDPTDPVVFSFVLSAADYSCVKRVARQKPEQWLEAHLRALVKQCSAAERTKELSAAGIGSVADLTPDDIAAITESRALKAAAKTANPDPK